MQTQTSISSADLQRTFESAVRDIHQADVAAGAKPKYGIPIVSKARVLGGLKPELEKRALSDAARALAQLWKV